MIYLLLVLVIIGMEHSIKHHVEKKVKSGDSGTIADGRIKIRKYHNHGAFLNMMEHSDILKLLSCALTLVIGCFFILTLFHRGNTLLKLGLSLLLGGAFSNTYDRIKKSYVVDYFSFNTPFPALNRIVFNISDFCILIGALICVLKSR